MMNLLQIERELLAQENLQNGLRINELREKQTQVENAQKAKFTNTLALSKVVVEAFEYFQSDECKQIFATEGVTWTTEDFAQKLFGWKKSYFYKVVKVGKLDEELIETFNSECERLIAEGLTPNRSVEGLLKYARATAEAETEAEAIGEDSEEAIGEEAEAAQVETRPTTLFTMSFKAAEAIGGDRGVTVRIDDAGNLITPNSIEEIQAAINFLISKFNNL